MNTGRILAFVTCDRVRWDEGSEDPIEEHGWIDVSWSPYVLHENRNDVPPIVDVEKDADPEIIFNEITEALNWLEGGYEDNQNGTFYAVESYQPHDQEWSYFYAIHFTRKFHHPTLGWAEKSFDPMTIPAIETWAESKPWAHRH